MNESEIISSRRKFLKNMAYGSLLMIGSIEVVNAKVKHIVLDPHSANPKPRVHDTLHQHPASQKQTLIIRPSMTRRIKAWLHTIRMPIRRLTMVRLNNAWLQTR
jgi:hypothetical protein